MNDFKSKNLFKSSFYEDTNNSTVNFHKTGFKSKYSLPKRLNKTMNDIVSKNLFRSSIYEDNNNSVKNFHKTGFSSIPSLPKIINNYNKNKNIIAMKI
jgi:hypothetical protein